MSLFAGSNSIFLNMYLELTKNAESELVDTEFQDIDAHAGGFATPVTNANSTSKINSKDRNTDVRITKIKSKYT